MTDVVLGLDFGTDSVRAAFIDADTGEEKATAVSPYGLWARGLFCDPASSIYRQHPSDYLASMEAAVREARCFMPGDAEGSAASVLGVAVATTGSTPVAVDRRGTPLALLPEFSENPHAMFILWKDHSGAAEAEEINALAKNWPGEDYTRFSGGVYSSEWFFAKILRAVRADARVRERAHSWVEHCDWIPWILTGGEDVSLLKRSRCAAGHKAMWNEEWGGLPSEAFLAGLDPRLAGLRARLFGATHSSDVRAGGLSREWARRLGLTEGIAVAVGSFDAHMGAVGAGIGKNTLCKVIGTSCCDIMASMPASVGDKVVPGICGQVMGSVLPGLVGFEAGQSAFGDAYAWFRELLAWPLRNLMDQSGAHGAGPTGFAGTDAEWRIDSINKLVDSILPRLAEEASLLEPGGSTGKVLALDWLNGRRTPFADASVKGAFSGLDLAVSAPALFRALVEATAFGARAVQDSFTAAGLPIDEVIALGGIAKKSEFVMQVLSDVLEKPVKVAAADQACALGAAMFAAVAAGKHRDVPAAQNAMASGYAHTYKPNPARALAYRKLYAEYLRLGRWADQVPEGASGRDGEYREYGEYSKEVT